MGRSQSEATDRRVARNHRWSGSASIARRARGMFRRYRTCRSRFCRTSSSWVTVLPASRGRSARNHAENLTEDSRRAWQAWFDNEVAGEAEAYLAGHAACRLCAAMRSIPRLVGPRVNRPRAGIPRYFSRMTRAAISVPEPARPAGAGNIPAASATALSLVQAGMRHALRCGRLHRRRRDDDTLLHCSIHRAVHEAGRHRR